MVKSILLPKLTHLLFSLPSPKTDIFKELNSLFFAYIWGNKRDKVSRKQMIQDYTVGGCRMIDIFTFAKSIKISWFRRMITSNTDNSFLMFVSSNCNIDKISSSGERYPLICAKNTNNLFWKEALLALQDFISISLKNERSLGNIPLLYNSNICIENRPIHFKSFFENGILFLSDLIDQSGNFLSFAEY